MAEHRLELNDGDRGVWLVTTISGSTYRLDLNANTVERLGGKPRPSAAPADTIQPLRGLIEIRIGRPGRWRMRNTSGGYTDADQVWQYSSVVVSIRSE